MTHVSLILLSIRQVDIYIYGRCKCYPRDCAIGQIPKVRVGLYIMSPLDYRNEQEQSECIGVNGLCYCHGRLCMGKLRWGRCISMSICMFIDCHGPCLRKFSCGCRPSLPFCSPVCSAACVWSLASVASASSCARNKTHTQTQKKQGTKARSKHKERAYLYT